MRRFTLNTAIVLALALTFSACGWIKSPTGPSDNHPGVPFVPPPINAPHSAIEFNLYHGDPTCIMGCSGPVPAVELISDRVDSGERTYAVTTKAGATHLLKVRVRFPVVGGHTVRLKITNYTEELVGIYPTLGGQGETGNNHSGIDFGVGFPTKNKAGTYPLEILVEEWGGDLPETVTIRAVINITLE